MRILALALSISAAGAPSGSDSQPNSSPPFWGKLAPGPFAVGFRSLWQLDYSRAYNTVFDDKSVYATGKAPKPILVIMWYPAEKSSATAPMTHRGYLKIETEDPRLAKFAAKLAEYERSIIGKFLTGKPDQELTETDRRRLEDVWNTLTASRRDAPALDGRFPLVIYHPGAKSSYEDNAVLCEFLASHGYFVIGSSFGDATGASLEVDGRQGSARDLEFLIAYARRMQNVDWHHVGLVGHSLGAQAILLYCARRLAGRRRGEPRYHPGLRRSRNSRVGVLDQTVAGEPQELQDAFAHGGECSRCLRARRLAQVLRAALHDAGRSEP